jgi:hypothetical protein
MDYSSLAFISDDIGKQRQMERQPTLTLKPGNGAQQPPVNTLGLWTHRRTSDDWKTDNLFSDGLNVEVNSDAKTACPSIARVASYLKLGVSLPRPPFCCLPSDSRHWRGWR